MKTFSILLSWDNFPEGGTYGTAIEAENSDEAEKLARIEMAELRCAESGDDPQDFLSQYGDEWDVLDLVEGGNIWSALEEKSQLEELLSEPNRDAILVGLNLLYEAITSGRLDGFKIDILTNGGKHKGLSAEEIQRLIENINQ